MCVCVCECKKRERHKEMLWFLKLTKNSFPCSNPFSLTYACVHTHRSADLVCIHIASKIHLVFSLNTFQKNLFL